MHRKWGSLGKVPRRKKTVKSCVKKVNIGHRELVNTGSRKFHHERFVISTLKFRIFNYKKILTCLSETSKSVGYVSPEGGHPVIKLITLM